jgi:Carboxypeptidase regulatory-like domain
LIRRFRWIAGAAAVLLSAACANVQPPTGGPVDSIAPRLVATRPDTNAVLERWSGPVIFVFDEELSEEGVQDVVTLSPRRGPVAVDKEGDEIRVIPRRGWETGIIYQVEVAPGLRDRFNNPVRTPSRLVFTTGPPIPDTRATGIVTDRVTGSPSTQARVDAIRIADSLVYSTQTDSAGRYLLAQVPEGEYRVIGYRDTNKNRRVDSYEQRDTALITLVAGQAPGADLALLPNDTTGPVVGSARPAAGGWIEVRFDDYLDPDQTVSTQQVQVVGPDSAAVAIAEVRIGEPPRVDSAAVAGDSTPEAPRPAGAARADSARADSVQRGPLPSQSLFVRTEGALIADTIYSVRVQGVRNVNGLVGGGTAPLRTLRPPPPPAPPTRADSAAAEPDSAAVAPPDSAGAGRTASASPPAARGAPSARPGSRLHRTTPGAAAPGGDGALRRLRPAGQTAARPPREARCRCVRDARPQGQETGAAGHSRIGS